MKTVTENKFIEITYKIIDQANAETLEQVDIPIGYVQGKNSPLFEAVMQALSGQTIGDVVEVKLSQDEAFGRRFEELTFTDDITNVPMQFREIGASVGMQNDKGDNKEFLVTKIEGGKLTIDGNHPLAGKDIIFAVKVASIRDATSQEIELGGPVDRKLNG